MTMLIFGIIILLATIATLIILFLKDLVLFINRSCSDLRELVGKNGGIFTIFFIFVFFAEQILLIITTSYFLEIPSKAQFIISLFALLVLTTATLEKLILEKRYEYLKKEVVIITSQNEEMFEEVKQISNRYQELYQKYLQLKNRLK